MAWHKITGLRRQVFGAFSIITGIILVVALIGITGINRISEDVHSIFYDRLYPAIEMAKITEKLYENRLMLEEYLAVDDSVLRASLLPQIRKNNKRIDSLSSKYAESHLVDEENKSLLMYKNEIFKYRQLEDEIVKLHRTDPAAAQLLFIGESSEEFKQIIEPIHQMTDVQLVIGNTLYEDSMKEARSVRFALYLAAGIVLLLFIILGAWLSFVYMNQG